LPEIRRAVPEDAEEIARLNSLFNGASEPAALYFERLNDPRRVDQPILAFWEGRAVALANLRLVPSLFTAFPYAELSELFVEEAYRRRGLGRALIQYAERLAVENGARQMLILTDFYNHPAQQLYRAAGYRHYDIALSKQLVKEDSCE